MHTSFGILLRVARRRQCLTQAQLAERSGLSPRAISDLELGKAHRPRRSTIHLLAQALRLSGGQVQLLLATLESPVTPEPARRHSPNPLHRS